MNEEKDLRKKTNLYGTTLDKRPKEALHKVWELIGLNQIERAAKEYVKEIENKTNIFKFAKKREEAGKPKGKSSIVYNNQELYSGLIGILRTLDDTLKESPLKDKDKALVFRMEVAKEIERLMKQHDLGTKGYLKIAAKAKEANDVWQKNEELKEDILKYSLF